MALVAGQAWYGYVDDQGNQHSTRVANNIGAQASTGLIAAVGTPTPDQVRPRQLVMRRARGVQTSTGVRGSIPVGTVTADLWTGVATTFLGSADDAGAQRTFVVTGLVGEKHRGIGA